MIPVGQTRTQLPHRRQRLENRWASAAPGGRSGRTDGTATSQPVRPGRTDHATHKDAPGKATCRPFARRARTFLRTAMPEADHPLGKLGHDVLQASERTQPGAPRVRPKQADEQHEHQSQTSPTCCPATMHRPCADRSAPDCHRVAPQQNRIAHTSSSQNQCRQRSADDGNVPCVPAEALTQPAGSIRATTGRAHPVTEPAPPPDDQQCDHHRRRSPGREGPCGEHERGSRERADGRHKHGPVLSATGKIQQDRAHQECRETRQPPQSTPRRDLLGLIGHHPRAIFGHPR